MKNPKFQIFKGKDKHYYFRLKAGNGEIISSSEGYTSLQNCRKGINVIKQIAVKAAIEVLPTSR
jgi:uncharacterized protein YegP (UPF0339 family)